MDTRIYDWTMTPGWMPPLFPLEAIGGSGCNGLPTVRWAPPERFSRLLSYPLSPVLSRPRTVIQPVPIYPDAEQTEPIDYSVQREPLDLSSRSSGSESQASSVPVVLNRHVYGASFRNTPTYPPYDERAYTNVNGNNHAAGHQYYRNGAEAVYTSNRHDIPVFIRPFIPHQLTYPYQPIYLHQPIILNQSALIAAIDEALSPVENLPSESRSSQPANGFLSSSWISSSTSRHPENNDGSIPNRQSISNYVVLEDETTRYEILESNNRQMETTQTVTSSGSQLEMTHRETSNNSQKETTQTETSSGSQLETTQTVTSSGSQLETTHRETTNNSQMETTQTVTSSGSQLETTHRETTNNSQTETTHRETTNNSQMETTQTVTSSGSQLETTHRETTNNSKMETTQTKTSSSSQMETTQSETSSIRQLTSLSGSSEVLGSVSKDDCPTTSEDQSAEVMERESSTSSGIMHTDENCFRCPLCNRGFGKLKIMKLHNKRCRDKESGRYKCSVCEKKLVQKSSLINHMRTHTGVKPYKCPVCSREFADRSTHTKHLRIHTKEQPFACPICSRRFNQSGNKIRHMKSKHLPKDS